MAITLDGTTGVTAAEFDGTVDASNLTGILPAIDGSALTGIDTSPPTTTGAVGTYAFLFEYSLDVEVRAPGDTLAGSSLYYAIGHLTNSATYNYSYRADYPATGTWRLMGAYSTIYNYNDYPLSIWMRIS